MATLSRQELTEGPKELVSDGTVTPIALPEDNEGQLSAGNNDDKGSYRTIGGTATASGKTLPKIKLKVQPSFDDPESEEETVRRPSQVSAPPSAPSQSKQQPKMSGKTVPKPKEILSIRDPPCWRCKSLNKPCEASSLRAACNQCYVRHWKCSENPPPPRLKKSSHSAPPKTKVLPVNVGGSISAGPTIRGRSPLRSASKPAKRPRSPTPPAAPAAVSSLPQSKKSRTSLRAVIKPLQVNGAAPSHVGNSGTRATTAQLPSLTELRNLKVQVDDLTRREQQSQALLERHSLVLDAVLENMKVLLGDRFIEVKEKKIPSALPVSFSAAAPDADIDELDELTPIERSPQPSIASTPLNGAAGPNTVTTNGRGSTSTPVDPPFRIVSTFDHIPAPSTSVPISIGPPYRAVLSASRTTTDNDDDGIEEGDDDVRSIPGISALSPASTTSAASMTAGSNKAHRFQSAPESPSHTQGTQIESLILQYPAGDTDDRGDGDSAQRG